MDRRALTLIELLIAITVLLAIMSLVMPSVFSRLLVTRGEEARGLIDAALVEARARAAREGEAIHVYVQERAEERFEIVYEPVGDQQDDVMTGGTLPAEMTSPGRSVDGVDRLSVEERVALPKGCRVVLRVELEALLSGDEMAAADDELREPDRTVAVLLPDGGLIAGERLALVTARGRAFEMTVRSWAGGVSFAAWRPEAALEEPDLGLAP